MDTDTNPVEICDLRNGRIVFSSEFHNFDQVQNQFVISVTNSAGIAREIKSNSAGRVLHFALPAEVLPIRTFEITDRARDAILFSATNLFPTTNREFETQFKSQRDRHGDPRVDFFVANQIFTHFTGAEGYRVSAAVVAAYKGIELLEESYLQDAEALLLQSLSALPKVHMARSARNNREHLHISVLCVLYHVHLARGNAEGFLRTLQDLRALLENGNFQSYYNLAYNSALSLRLLTLLQLVAGQPSDARETAALSFEVFKLASRDADDNLTHFKELRYVHDNTYESMRIARRVKEVTDALIEKTLRGCLRVSADAHHESYAVMRQTFLESTRAQRSD